MEFTITSSYQGETKTGTFIIDDEDWDKVKVHKWQLSSGYARALFKNFHKRRYVKLQNFLLNCPKGLVVDHIDRNIKNNRKSNLRICTHAENCRNMSKPRISSSSIYRGVHWVKEKEKWTTQISSNNSNLHLGYFVSEVQAACRYDDAARFYHGQYANVNFPTEQELLVACIREVKQATLNNQPLRF